MTTIPPNSHIIRRDSLKKKKRMTDQELLADAMRQAKQWKESITNNK